MTWWERVPYGMVKEFVWNIPILQAGEDLNTIQAGIAASGNMRKQDLDQYVRRLTLRSEGATRQKRPMTPDKFAEFGIVTDDMEGGI